MEAHFQMKHSLTSRVYQLLDPSIPRQNPRHTCHGRNIKKLMLKVNTTYGGKCEWCFPFSSSFKGWQIEGTLNKNIQKHTKTKVPCKQFFIISSEVFYFKFPQLQRGGFWVLGMDDRLPPRCAIGRLGPLASMGKALIHGLKLKYGWRMLLDFWISTFKKGKFH